MKGKLILVEPYQVKQANQKTVTGHIYLSSKS